MKDKFKKKIDVKEDEREKVTNKNAENGRIINKKHSGKPST